MRDRSAADVEDTPAGRTRAQAALAALTTRLFAAERIRVRPAPGTVRVVVQGPTGGQVVAQGIDGVLDAVERLRPGRVDWTSVAARARALGDDDRDVLDRDLRALTGALDRRTGALR
ncbi:hypothetical protein HUN58_17235 [Curtobacterium sp. Csp1]|uniref:hypothetical protein n=1 Tax=Curtobacterium sp. Csp1 TaxID=2495429 RepID=UPI0015979865|nr:hypothetical protein [Curtobacterium sp. Csp1]QKS21446.1 hypothetical protein HUN58_17235 [Curtobacterium sp. Csp1]